MSAPADGALAAACDAEPEAPTRRHLPVVAPVERVSRAGQRARTVSLKRFGKRALAEGARLYPTPDVERPLLRADCLAGGINEARPCPWVSCAAHLALDVNERNGNIKINFPGVDGDPDLDAMPETCALDVADRGGITLEEVGGIANLTRERIRQIEDISLDRLRGAAGAALADYADTMPTPLPVVAKAPVTVVARVDWFADEALDLTAEPGVDAAWSALAAGANDDVPPVEAAPEPVAAVALVTPETIIARDHYRDEADAEIARLTAALAAMREQRDAAEAEIARSLRRVSDGHALAARLDRVRAQRDEARALVNAVMAAGLAECERLRAVAAVPPVLLLDEVALVRVAAEAARMVLRGVAR